MFNSLGFILIYSTKCIYIHETKFGWNKACIQKHLTEQNIWSVNYRLKLYFCSLQNDFIRYWEEVEDQSSVCLFYILFVIELMPDIPED